MADKMIMVDAAELAEMSTKLVKFQEKTIADLKEMNWTYSRALGDIEALLESGNTA